MQQCERDTLLVWQRMAQKAYRSKSEAINSLYCEGKIPEYFYCFGCPLCSQYNELFTSGCPKCPWPELPITPGRREDRVKCLRLGSPYSQWNPHRMTSRYRARKANTQVFLYIKAFLTDKYGWREVAEVLQN